MKRTPEFILGLIGSIWATLVSIGSFVIAGFVPATSTLGGAIMITNVIGFIVSVIAIVMACMVNKKTQLSGVLLIISAVVIFLTNFIQLLPAILMLISGIMCLARKLPTNRNL